MISYKKRKIYALELDKPEFKNMMKVNLGCGKQIKPGWTNIDNEKQLGVDVVHNLEVLPYPFQSNTVDFIYMSHVLEHLDNPYEVILECHRILKHGGLLEILVPHFKDCKSSLSMPHKRFFHEHSIHCFIEDEYSCQSKNIFSLELCIVSHRFPLLHRFTGLFNNSFFGWTSEIHWILKKR